MWFQLGPPHEQFEPLHQETIGQPEELDIGHPDRGTTGVLFGAPKRSDLVG